MGALAGMIDAIIEEPATFLVPVAQRQGMRIERAENDLWLIFGGAEMRQIDVVKQAWFGRPSRELSKDPRHPRGRPLPVKLHLVAAIVRKRYTRPAMQHRLAHCRHGSRIVDISPQIAAVIDATEHPLGIRNKLEQSNARAIRRGSINGKSFLSARFDPERTMRCHGMADARLRTCWRDHDRLTDRACRAQQRLQAGSVDAVVIAKEELHGTQLDGHKRLSISRRHSYFSINIRTARAGSKAVNIELLPVLIVEEVRTLFDADSKLSEMLPEMERASLSPQVRKAINRRRDLEQSQSKSLAEILARFDAHPSGGQCHTMRGLIGEAEEVLRRESGMYPARLEPRLLGVLRKVGHLRMAALKNLIAVAQLLEAHEIKKTLEDCLSQEVEADRFVADLTDDMLRLMTANSHGETANALDALQRYS